MKAAPFDKSALFIDVPDLPDLHLRSVTSEDLDLLRHWKNQQKQFFFYQDEISPEQQLKWYEAFSQRPYDLLTMTVYQNKVFGCMGIRLLEDHWDIYNVILGDVDFGKKGLMGRSFKVLINYALDLKLAPINLKVLKDNPAVSWYQKQGFSITEKNSDHFSMCYQIACS